MTATSTAEARDILNQFVDEWRDAVNRMEKDDEVIALAGIIHWSAVTRFWVANDAQP